MKDIAADETRSGRHAGRKACGKAEADDSFASSCDRLPEEPLELFCLTAPCDGSDTSGSRSDAGFDTESCRGDDESRGSPLLAHIPTRTEVALATLRLR